MPNNDKPSQRVLLGSSPHVHSGMKTRFIMLSVILALLPLTVNSVRLFGVQALALILVCVASSVVWELLFQLVTRRRIMVGDCSAALSGLLLALILPPAFPWYLATIGSFFSMVVAKEFFGGLGANPFNPALIGRAILLMSFPSQMTTWHRPGMALLDATTTATPLGVLREAAMGKEALSGASSAMQKLNGPLSELASSLGVSSIRDVYHVLFLGNHAGSLGETSILLVLVGALVLLLLRVIDPIVPFAVLGSTALLSWAIGVDPLFAVLSGGVAFGAFFMATDYSTSPITPLGRLIFGLGIGLIIVLIRKFGGFPEGVTYAILIMNAFSPMLDKLRVRKYGFVKAAKGAGK